MSFQPQAFPRHNRSGQTEKRS